LLLAPETLAQSLELRGLVLDAATHEPIAKALVSIRDSHIEAITNDAGEFILVVVPPGQVELYVSTVGYGLLKREVDASRSAGLPLEILLGQEVFRRSYSITVTTNVFEPLDTNSVSEHKLNNIELDGLANVLVDDPLRSVQTLPGVTANDDFNAE